MSPNKEQIHEKPSDKDSLPVKTEPDFSTFLQSIIEHNPQAMWIADALGNMLAMNQACINLLPLYPNDEQGCYNILKDIVLEEQGFMPLVKNLFENAVNARFFAFYNTNSKQGKLSGERLEVNISPITNADGKLTHAIIQYIPVANNGQTEQDLQQILSLTEATLESIHNGILVVDQKGKILKTNQRFAAMWRIPMEVVENGDDEIVMNSIIYQLEEPEKFIAKVTELYHHPLEESDELIFFKDGRIFERISKPMLLNGEPAARVWSFLDVTESKQAEQTLFYTSELLEHTAEIAKAGGWVIDFKTGYRYWSKETCRILEIDPPITPELGSEINLSFYAPEALPIIKAAIKAGMEKGISFDLEVPMITKKGRRIWVRDQGSFILEDGRTVKAKGVMLDITERKKVEDKLKQLSQAVEQSPVSIVITDTKGDIEYVNQKFVELTGYSFEEAIGKNPRILKSGEKPLEEYLEMWETLAHNEEWRGEFHNVKKNGELYWESATISPILNTEGETTHFLAIKEDISSRKEAENILRKYADELKSSNADLENFAYMAGHDLHEPLRMVTSFLKLLEKKLGTQLSAENKKYIDFAVDGAKRMKQLIDALLQYSRIGANKEQFLPTNLNEVLEYTLQISQKNIEQKRASITVMPMPVITANKTLITELFINLVNNALKYQGDQLPEIEVGYTDKQDSFQFYVKDNGIGIAPQDFDRIFIIFQRLHAKSNYPGTGIGLALCKKIVDTHKGKIWVESEPGKGSTFYFSIPK